MNLRSAVVAAVVLLAASLVGLPAMAQQSLRGVALVIGNGAYRHLAALGNPEADARAVEQLLSGLGFDATLTSDRDARRLERDLRDFVDDARGADVAVLYYAGHGIEAGGENWLVPVDADIGALDDAADKLVPLSRILSELQASVGVTIVLLDACRDNPFPAGATLKLASGEAATVSVGGLVAGDTRGASRMAGAPAPKAGESLGAVIGFAAEPGKVALDGAPGQNSPYAAALIRHLTALAGAEFGQVMRMVGEEVYLKTGGRQRPWMNESLRRLLYFGSNGTAAPSGDQGDILAERRQLLLTIAALPGPERVRVETAAREGGVPLDALYAVLAALGQDAPADPRSLEQLLREQAGRIKKIKEERDSLSTTDPEIVRLLSLADQALGEGALKTAIQLNERAKERVKVLSATIDDAEEQVGKRRAEFAEVYARSAEAYELAADFENAAADWKAAYDLVAGNDDGLASAYRLGQSNAVKNIGHHSGNLDTLEQAVELAREASTLAEEGSAEETRALRFLGDNLYLLGWHTDRAELIDEGIGMYDAALALIDKDADADEWVEIQLSLGNALEYLSWLQEEDDDKRGLLTEAMERYEAVMEVRTRDDAPADWAASASLAAVALYQLANIERDPEMAAKAIEFARGASQAVTAEDDPEGWAVSLERLGGAYRVAGHIAEQTDEAADFYLESVKAVRSAVDSGTRPPPDVANALNNIGDTYLDLWELSKNRKSLDDAEAAFAEAMAIAEQLEADELRSQTQKGLDTVAEMKAAK